MIADKLGRMKLRIEQLLRKAESTTAAEAEALTAAAEKLMLKYGIEAAMLNAEEKTDKIVVEHVRFVSRWQDAWLCGFAAVVRAFGLTALSMKDADGGVTLIIVGYSKDVSEVKALVESLVLQSQVAMTAWWSSEGLAQAKLLGYSNHRRHVEKRSFMEAFGCGAARRIEREREDLLDSVCTGTALVLADRSEEVERWTYQTFNVGKARRRRQQYGALGAGAGAEAGERAMTKRQVGAAVS